MSTILHPNHALMMTAKKFLLQCLSQLPADKVRNMIGAMTVGWSTVLPDESLP